MNLLFPTSTVPYIGVYAGLRVLATIVLIGCFQLRAGYCGTHSAVNDREVDTKPDFSQEPVVFEYIHESMRYESDGSGVTETQSRIRVQTTAGLNFAGQLAFSYSASDEQMEARSVRVPLLTPLAASRLVVLE